MRYPESTNTDSVNATSANKDFIKCFPKYDADVEVVRAWLLTWFTNQNIHPRNKASIEKTISQLLWTRKDVRQLPIIQLFADFRGYGAKIINNISIAREGFRSHLG